MEQQQLIINISVLFAGIVIGAISTILFRLLRTWLSKTNNNSKNTERTTSQNKISDLSQMESLVSKVVDKANMSNDKTKIHESVSCIFDSVEHALKRVNNEMQRTNTVSSSVKELLLIVSTQSQQIKNLIGQNQRAQNLVKEISKKTKQIHNDDMCSSQTCESSSIESYQRSSIQDTTGNQNGNAVQGKSKNENLKPEPMYKLYISIEEAMNGCQKLVPLYDSEGNEEIIIVDLYPGIKDREVFAWDKKTIEVRYIKHPYLSRRGNDLVIDKKAVSKGVQHPRSNKTFKEKDEEKLKSLGGFQEGVVIIE
ncbi:hypothetical protein EDI_216600 [Entamoeba dispar SAW760]|uniref:Uncharacterized protein n=1 Tax=Entamoeba dispar (strain ATCC PRA-260 / SAW760) TaxID=370354 RepID=B0EKT1_ENTDS|nr:uncharacterized protein EDI_216600 [Entamoeba dispar SAW760]EDR24851.1 hypothetical protein EDI_216600 [Entamoeba dispar SAW760]|eukprot:EDR24851.1 hypothetical protein EDI_216600 [Entamoeba dispar SAW760]